jgi:hypothetical protein
VVYNHFELVEIVIVVVAAADKYFAVVVVAAAANCSETQCYSENLVGKQGFVESYCYGNLAAVVVVAADDFVVAELLFVAAVGNNLDAAVVVEHFVDSKSSEW